MSSIEGRVSSITQTKLIPNSFVDLTIESSPAQIVKYPLKIESPLQLIPYQIALVGEAVKYTCSAYESEIEYELVIMSGKLIGNSYKNIQKEPF